MALHETKKCSEFDDLFDKGGAQKPLSKFEIPDKILQHFVKLLPKKKFTNLWMIVLIKI